MAIQTIGRLELIFGSMFSGKTEEMIRRLRRGQIAGQKILLVKPSRDTRYDNVVMTHDGRVEMKVQVVSCAYDILSLITPDISIVGIEETQFFNGAILHVIHDLLEKRLRVICCGLDMWSTGEAIPLMGNLACIADSVTKLNAVCVGCGADAYLSQKTVEGDSIIDIGGADKYKALCRDCLESTSI